MPVEQLATNPLLGASILASLLAGFVALLTLIYMIGIGLDFYSKQVGYLSIGTGLGAFIYIAFRYPASDTHNGLVNHMLSLQEFGVTVFGDVTLFGLLWLTAILLFPVIIGIVGVTKDNLF